MDATCKIQDSIHVFRLVHKYVSRILGTYHNTGAHIFGFQLNCILIENTSRKNSFAKKQICLNIRTPLLIMDIIAKLL